MTLISMASEMRTRHAAESTSVSERSYRVEPKHRINCKWISVPCRVPKTPSEHEPQVVDSAGHPSGLPAFSKQLVVESKTWARALAHTVLLAFGGIGGHEAQHLLLQLRIHLVRNCHYVGKQRAKFQIVRVFVQCGKNGDLQ
jgi:hypothetical protein